MPLSIQGNKVISHMWDVFRPVYVEANPGANLNDVERIFLYTLLSGLVRDSDSSFAVYSKDVKEAQELIEAIR